MRGVQRQRERDAMGLRRHWSGAIILVVMVLTLTCSNSSLRWIVTRAGAATSQHAAATQVTTSDVYRNVGKALDRSGQTFVERSTIATVTTDTSKSTKTATTTTERVWADARNNRARVESLGQPTVAGVVVDSKRVHTTISGSSEGQNKAPATCHGASATVSFVLSCPDRPTDDERSVQSVTSGRWHGRNAVVLVTKEIVGRGTNIDERFTYRLYLDPKTWLPFARTVAGVPTTTDPLRRDSNGPVRSIFVETAHLPSSFFTAASIDRWVSSQAT
jgi:hypothetical protein